MHLDIHDPNGPSMSRTEFKNALKATLKEMIQSGELAFELDFTTPSDIVEGTTEVELKVMVDDKILVTSAIYLSI